MGSHKVRVPTGRFGPGVLSTSLPISEGRDHLVAALTAFRQWC